jgi:hypothetical protein
VKINNEDLKAINLRYLMLAKKCAQTDPNLAVIQFNLNRNEVDDISKMSLEQIKNLSNCGRIFIHLPSAIA